MDAKAVFEALQNCFGDAVFDLHADEKKDFNPWFFVRPELVGVIAKHLRSDPELAFDYLECLSGVDYPDKNEIHVVYHLFSYGKKHRAVLKTVLPRDAPKISTVSTVWSAANWQERECFDLFGVQFEGHPDLRRLLLPEDWVGYPLRKDYQEQADYQGIPTTRTNPLELLTRAAKAKQAKDAPKADASKAADEPKAKVESAGKGETKAESGSGAKGETNKKSGA